MHMENVKVTVEAQENCVRVLDVEVPADEVYKQIEELLEETKRTATVPGFRPGRVPRKVLERRFGKRVRETAIDGAVAESYEEALKSEELTAIADPDIQDVRFEENEPLKYRAVIEVSPRALELVEYKGLVLERDVREVTDADVERVLENTRQAHAVYVPRDAKAAADGDLMVIDYQGAIEGEPFEGGEGESVTLVLGGRGFFPQFSEALRGLVPESETEVKVTFPEDYDRKDLAGREAVFRVKVKEVKERVVPALDKEFAKEAGNCDTLDEFRNRIREQIETTERNRGEAHVRGQAASKIAQGSTFELPQSAIEHVAQEILDERVRELHQAGVAEKDIRENEDKLQEECIRDAEESLKIACLEQEIAKREGLTVTDEEIEQEKTDLKETGVKAETVDSYFDAPNLRERYRLRMLRRKALDLVLEAARIKDVPVAAEEPTEPQGDEGGSDAEQTAE
jgi:trigger factor